MDEITAAYADALGISADEATNELADYVGLVRDSSNEPCPTCSWPRWEHNPGEFGADCPYGV